MDEQEILFRCHALSDFAGTPQEERSNPYNKAIKDIGKAKDELTGLKTESAITKRKELIAELEAKLPELAKEFKDKVYLSPTAQKRILQLARQIKYGITENLDNKQLQKGILVEDESITLYGKVIGKMLTKNTERFSDNLKTGEPDLITIHDGELSIDDIKSSFNKQTFDNKLDKLPASNFAQAQGYMDLKDCNQARIVYCLSNTPVELIKAELRNALWKHKPHGMTMDEFMIAEEVDGVNLQKIRTQYFRNGIYSDDGFVLGDNGWEYLTEGYWNYLTWTENLDESYKFIPIPDEERVKIFRFRRDRDYMDKINSRLLVAQGEVKRLLDSKLGVQIIDLTQELCKDKETKD